MKKLLVTALLASACIAALPFAAFSAEVSQAGADKLKASLAGSLETRAAVLKKEGITLNQTGTMMAEVADGYYAVTTPELSMTMPGGITRNIGMVAINANPEAGSDTRYRVAVALPTPVNDVETATPGSVVQSLVFGQQSFSGIWDTNVQNVTSFDATYKDVTLTRPHDSVHIQLPDLATSLALKNEGQNIWSGPWSANVKNLSYTGANGVGATAANLRGKVQFQNIDFTQKDMAARMGDKLDAQALGDGIGFTLETGLKGTIGQGALNAQATGLKADKGKLTVSLNLDTIATQGLAPGYGPTSFVFNANGDDLPARTIITKFRDMTPKEFAQTLGRSGGNVTVSRLNIEAPEYSISATGNFKAAAKGFYGLEGNMKLRVRGAEKLTQWLNTPDAAKLFGGTVPPQLVATFAIVQLTGQPASDEQGRAVKVFDLQATADGKLLLNGTDISSIAGKL